MFLNRWGGAAVAVLAAGIALAGSTEPRHGAAAITCTNPASGTNWQIKLDYDKGTVDANPARFSDARISWHDINDGGNYTLDRKSGALTFVAASSTGGFFLFHRCAVANSG